MGKNSVIFCTNFYNYVTDYNFRIYCVFTDSIHKYTDDPLFGVMYICACAYKVYQAAFIFVAWNRG